MNLFKTLCFVLYSLFFSFVKLGIVFIQKAEGETTGCIGYIQKEWNVSSEGENTKETHFQTAQLDKF